MGVVVALVALAKKGEIPATQFGVFLADRPEQLASLIVEQNHATFHAIAIKHRSAKSK